MAGAVDSMRYDVAGNMIEKRTPTSYSAPYLYATITGSNRLASDSTAGLNNRVDHYYTGSGARRYERPHNTIDASNAVRVKAYDYDGLGRAVGFLTATWHPTNGVEWHNRPDNCRYDPDGQYIMACTEQSPWLTMDGSNASAAIDANSIRWQFIHGPGVDDPLMAVLRNPQNNWAMTGTEMYYVTDGNGRQFAAGEKDGDLPTNSKWTFAGGTQRSEGFGADRFSDTSVPGVSFFRNRAYDSRTGRWTQEDPIGVAGDLNLYQFNGNDPVAYTDPFGLCPDENGNDDGKDCEIGDIKAAHNFWLNLAGEGRQTGGLLGWAKVAAGVAASTLLDFSGATTVDNSATTLADPEATAGEKVVAAVQGGLAAAGMVAGGSALAGANRVAAGVRAGTLAETGHIPAALGGAAYRGSRLYGVRNAAGRAAGTDAHGFYFALDIPGRGHWLHIGGRRF